MSAVLLLNRLCAEEIQLRVEGDMINYRGREGRLTPALLDLIRQKKAGLMELIRDLPSEIHHIVNQIVLGDALERLKNIPDSCIDSTITDPPYGLKFMGKDWDKAIPVIEIWKEIHRVLKPGAFLCVMSSPRQDLLARMVSVLEATGFKTGFTPLYWTYASGFPKARNIYRAIVKDTKPATSEAEKLDGSYAGFQPKPAVEVILVAMKPRNEKSYRDQALDNGKGVTWLDDCRIPYENEMPNIGNRHKHGRGDGYGYKPQWRQKRGIKWSPEKEWKQDIERQAHENGRFPANLLVSDAAIKAESKGALAPVKKGQKGFGGEIYGKYKTAGDDGASFYSDKETSTSYSRFFSLDAWADRNLPFLIVPKASTAEKEAGLEHLDAQRIAGRDPGQDERNNAFKVRPSKRRNTHPTVKPLKLMSYLITMFSRPGDIVLDPFCGSGTTCIAAEMLERRFIGIEKEQAHHEIAVRRLFYFRNIHT